MSADACEGPCASLRTSSSLSSATAAEGFLGASSSEDQSSLPFFLALLLFALGLVLPDLALLAGSSSPDSPASATATASSWLGSEASETASSRSPQPAALSSRRSTERDQRTSLSSSPPRLPLDLPFFSFLGLV